jgi:hypothetical protein
MVALGWLVQVKLSMSFPVWQVAMPQPLKFAPLTFIHESVLWELVKPDHGIRMSQIQRWPSEQFQTPMQELLPSHFRDPMHTVA